MSPDIKKSIIEAKQAIEESEYILIAGHTNPDGDSLGSVLALHWALQENLGKKTMPYMSDKEVPKSLNFLPGSEMLSDKILSYPDLIIGVDYGDFERLNIPEDIVRGAKIITFDHHPYSKQRGDIKIIKTEFSSTTELVYTFFKEVNWHISKRVALCLLTGILTDTGAFSYNTSARTLETVGELIDKGVSLQEIYLKTFADKSVKILNIWGDLLKQMKIDKMYNYAFIYLNFDKFQKYGIVLDDLTGFISVMNASKESNFSILVIEYEHGKIKGSIRSDKFKDVDVSDIAKKLGGGGHKYASGFSIDGSIEEATEKINDAIASSLSATD